MSGRGQGRSRKPTRLSRRIRPSDIERAVAESDQRAAAIRFHADAVQRIKDDLGGDLSFLQQRVAHRATHLDALLSEDEATLTEARVQARFLAEGRLTEPEEIDRAKRAIAAGAAVDRQLYLAGVASWSRMLKHLGTKRVARNVRTLREDIAEQTSAPTPAITPLGSDRSTEVSPPASGQEDCDR